MEDNLKDRIIEKSREKFFSSGFSKVTMDEIALELGISKKTLYKYFPSKDRLLEEIIQRQIFWVSGQIHQIVTAEIDFIEKLHRLWTFMGQMLSQIGKPFQDDIRRLKPELWKRVDQFRREKIFANFTRLFAEGAQLGALRSNVNTEILVRMYANSIQGIINPDVLSHSSFSGEEAFRNILSILFEGILSDTARKHYQEKIGLENPARL